MNAEYISWDEVERFVAEVKAFCIPRHIKGIYGIPRGGNVLATMVSYRTGLPLLQAPAKDCLIIDDISDSGKTLLHYKEKGYAIATMCYKESSLVEPDMYYRKTEEWVVFPWEGGYDESK
jgi:hypoxanthine phosphoribosyltransferase